MGDKYFLGCRFSLLTVHLLCLVSRLTYLDKQINISLLFVTIKPADLDGGSFLDGLCQEHFLHDSQAHHWTTKSDSGNSGCAIWLPRSLGTTLKVWKGYF